jgi:hypothetical protein
MQKCSGTSFKLWLMAIWSAPTSLNNRKTKSLKILPTFTPADSPKPEEASLLKATLLSPKPSDHPKN